MYWPLHAMSCHKLLPQLQKKGPRPKCFVGSQNGAIFHFPENTKTNNDPSQVEAKFFLAVRFPAKVLLALACHLPEAPRGWFTCID